MPAGFRERLLKIGLKQVKPTLYWLIQQQEFSEAYKEERYDFLRSDKAFNHSIKHAREAYDWQQMRLGRARPSAGKPPRKVVAAAQD